LGRVAVPKNDAHVLANFAPRHRHGQDLSDRLLLDGQAIAPGATGTADARLFAGAKEVLVINDYEKKAQPQPSIC